MDVKKLIQILKKMLTIAKVLFNFLLFMCCYLAFKTIKEKDIEPLIFALNMFVMGICGLVFIKWLRVFLFGEDE